MPHIYETFQTVLVWIDKADNQTKRAFSEARRLTAARGVSNIENPNSMSYFSRDDLLIPFNETAKDLFSIFQRGWFRRIWVIQEVSICCKATVVCGPLTIEWEDLSAALFAVAVPGKIIDGPGGRPPMRFSNNEKSSIRRDDPVSRSLLCVTKTVWLLSPRTKYMLCSV